MNSKQIVLAIQETMTSRGGLQSVYFVGCGGSQAALYPGKYFLQREAKHLIIDIYNSNEFVHSPPKALGEKSIVICCSLTATAETVAAVHLANACGAVTIAMTGSTDTLMAKTGQYVLVYSSGDQQIYAENNQAIALRLAIEILHVFQSFDYYAQAQDAFLKIDSLFLAAKSAHMQKAKLFARTFMTDTLFYVLGSGPLYYTAYSMACCHLMEMQWKHSVFLHSGEYFHGPFETTETNTAIVLFKSSGLTRPLDERVERFLQKHSLHFIVLDALESGIDQLDSKIAEFFEPLIMTPLERYFVYEMSLVRGHSMDERRYMWKEAY